MCEIEKKEKVIISSTIWDPFNAGHIVSQNITEARKLEIGKEFEWCYPNGRFGKAMVIGREDSIHSIQKIS